jgi:hypothetical protein
MRSICWSRTRDTQLIQELIADGTSSSNLLSSSSQSVSAVNPEAVGEKPRALAAVCEWLGT